MFSKTTRKSWLLGIAAMALVLTGCGESKYVDAEKYQFIEARSTQNQAKQSLNNLEKALNSGQIRNARLIELYSDQIIKAKPDLELIVKELKKESGTKGMLFSGLRSRIEASERDLKSARDALASSPKDDAAYLRALNKYNNSVIPENQALLGATQPDIYNDALSDIVNTLADMSDDKLARVDGKKSSDFYRDSGAENKGAGTLLVGNPNYGEWKQDSSGNSFWAFYGQMMFLNTLLDLNTRPYYYNSWYSHRPYSSYQDYYGSRYGSYKHRNRTSSLNKKYNINPKVNRSKAAQSHIKKNPTVSKNFKKFDNQFARKAPQSKVLNRTSVKPKPTVSKLGNGGASKWSNQYSGSKSTRSTSGSRSSRGGK